jgi:hypothetical protein
METEGRLERRYRLLEQLYDLLRREGWERRFRAWLFAQGLDRSVGVAVENAACPLALYIKDRIRDSDLRVNVGTTEARLMEQGLYGLRCLADVRLSQAAQRFVMCVDDRHRKGDLVSAGEALAALARAVEAVE